MEERAKKIIEACLQEKSKNPVEIFYNVAHKEFVRIHGPEHHVLDGASLLTAFYNAGGKIDLQESLNELMKRGLQMPGALKFRHIMGKTYGVHIKCIMQFGKSWWTAMLQKRCFFKFSKGYRICQ